MISVDADRSTLTMNLLNFTDQFPDERKSNLKYKEAQDGIGILYSAGGPNEHCLEK